jgi:eukaryotic-like serine/threonine-protein kinase
VLYEMATGRPPFIGDARAAIVDALLEETPAPVRSLNSSAPPELERILSKALEKDRAVRYQSASEILADLSRLKESGRSAAAPLVRAPGQARGLPLPKPWALAAVALVAVAAVAVYFYLHPRQAHRLTQQDTVVLADFTNTTGDPVFDGTLRQGLSAQLEQSPFLNLVSDTRVAQTLALMTQPRDARLTPELAREVCQRTASAATIEGSIASLGSQYVLGLRAVNCHNGDTLATEQVTASGKERVIKALGEAATKMREKLGESLASVEKYDTPPENVTTPSLEALQAYSLGYRAQIVTGDPAAATAPFQRAISLDPNFAMAYARLGMNFANLSETVRAEENTRKAYELRQRVSEREKFYIASHYEHYVAGDLEAARKAYELWLQTYPRDATPPTNLGSIYFSLGEYGKALAALQEDLGLEPGSGQAYANLVSAYLALNQLDKAKVTAQKAQAHNLDSPPLHAYLYWIDFLQHDAAGMAREASEVMAKPGYEDWMLNIESNTAAFGGQFAKARALTRRAVDSARLGDEKETAAGYVAEAAVREALVGNMALASRQARSVVALSRGKDVEDASAVALALAGDPARAKRLADDLAGRFPRDTIVQSQYMPVIRAASILGTRPEDAGRAIATLETAEPYELGSDPNVTLQVYPPYLRGEAYLAAHHGTAAAAEFQKILGHPGIVGNELIGALAHLGLGRAYALEARSAAVSAAVAGASRSRTKEQGRGQEPVLSEAKDAHGTAGETSYGPEPTDVGPPALQRARNAYQDFFALWKDADPDIPILKQAKAEYAKLK